MLSEELLYQKIKHKNLSEVKVLNLYGNDLEDIQILKKLNNIEILSLSLNKISSLKPLKNCLHLKELYLRKNNISNLSEINYLTNLKNLKILWLEENPISNLPNYKIYILNKLPQLVKLDNYEINNIKINKYIKRNNTEIYKINHTNEENIKYNYNNKSKEKKIILKRVSSNSIESNSYLENINFNKYLKNNLSSFLKNNSKNISKEGKNLLLEKKIISQNRNILNFKKLKLKIKLSNNINNDFSNLNTNNNINNNTLTKREKINIRNIIPISKSGINLIKNELKKNENEMTIVSSKDVPNFNKEFIINSNKNKFKETKKSLIEKAMKYINKMTLNDLIELKNKIDCKIKLINNIEKIEINNFISN